MVTLTRTDGGSLRRRTRSQQIPWPRALSDQPPPPSHPLARVVLRLVPTSRGHPIHGAHASTDVPVKDVAEAAKAPPLKARASPWTHAAHTVACVHRTRAARRHGVHARAHPRHRVNRRPAAPPHRRQRRPLYRPRVRERRWGRRHRQVAPANKGVIEEVADAMTG